MTHRLELFAHGCCPSRPSAVSIGHQMTRRLGALSFVVEPLSTDSQSAAGQRICCSPTWVFDGRVIWAGPASAGQLIHAIRGAMR
jgi:hypothetical protein